MAVQLIALADYVAVIIVSKAYFAATCCGITCKAILAASRASFAVGSVRMGVEGVLPVASPHPLPALFPIIFFRAGGTT